MQCEMIPTSYNWGMLYIRCSKILGPKTQITDGAILLDGTKILAVDSASQLAPPAGAKELDAHSLTAAPGYIDWQLNGGFGLDFTENPENIWDVAAKLPEHGVTAFLPTIITAPLNTYSTAQQTLSAGPPKGFHGAKPLGLHFEGPYLNPGKKGAHNPAYLRSPALDETRLWSRKNSVWLVTLAPELPGAIAMIQALRKNDIVISAGHSLATYEQALEAFAAGVTSATHLFNAMPALDHRQPGLIAACLADNKVTAGLIPDGIHVHPAMVKLAWKNKGARCMAIVTDAMAALGMKAGVYGLGDYEVTVNETSARLKDGTLAGSIVHMDQAVRNLMQFSGCSLAQAIGAASINPARLIGADQKGRLQPGADADLLLMDSQGNLMLSIANGEVAFSRL